MAKEDMEHIEKFIKKVGDDLAERIQTTKMEKIAKDHFHEGMKDLLGVDADIVSEVRDIRANMNFIRSFRKASEKIGMTVIIALASALTLGAAAAMWRGLGR